MDDVKSKKTQEIKGDDFSELIKLVLFSGIGCCIFFLPLSINRQVVFPVFFIFTYFSKPVINFSKYLYKICFKFDITV